MSAIAMFIKGERAVANGSLSERAEELEGVVSRRDGESAARAGTRQACSNRADEAHQVAAWNRFNQ